MGSVPLCCAGARRHLERPSSCAWRSLARLPWLSAGAVVPHGSRTSDQHASGDHGAPPEHAATLPGGHARPCAQGRLDPAEGPPARRAAQRQTQPRQALHGDACDELRPDRYPARRQARAAHGGVVCILSARGFYNDLTFHRVAAGFVIQGGDPDGDGSGGPGYTVVEPPPRNLNYTLGTVAMAKTGTEPAGASGSQFFIVTAKRRCPPSTRWSAKSSAVSPA